MSNRVTLELVSQSGGGSPIVMGDAPLGKVAFDLVSVEPGTYTVGSREGEGDSDERPRHAVELTRGYQLGVVPVTQALWHAVTGKRPSRFKGGERPVEQVSWHDAVGFCNGLSERFGLSPAYRLSGESVSCDFDAPGFRLPTEHEWEVGARAGTEQVYAGSDSLDEVGWYRDNSGDETHAVGQKQANGWGLHDMSGNVWEWCWDWYGGYPDGTVRDPRGPQSGAVRVRRGGAWDDSPQNARVAYRSRFPPVYRFNALGVRLARTIPRPSIP